MSSREKVRRFPIVASNHEEAKGASPEKTRPCVATIKAKNHKKDELQAQLQHELLEEGPPTCIVDSHGNILYANPEFERIKRALAAEGLLPHPKTAELIQIGDATVALKIGNKREVYRPEQRSLDGWNENVSAFVYHSVRSKVQLQQKIIELSNRLEDVTRLVSDWVWETDRDFAFTFVSEQVTEVLGFHPRELEGGHLEKLIVDLPEPLERIVSSGARSPFRDLEVKIRHKNGKEKVLRLSGLPVYDPSNGTFTGFRGTAGDVTALRNREEALIGAKETAELANRAKTEFLANMSHELRTPLNAVIGFSEIMEQEILGSLGSEKYKSYASDIHSSAQHLLKLINDILDIAKIESGGHELSPEEFRPRDVVKSVARLISERCLNAEQNFIIALPNQLPNLYADECKIKQVLLNLLSNAHKFTPHGGEIRIEASLEADGSFAFRITDNGIGIAAEDMHKAFAPFEQVDSRLARQYEGTGLGLPLSLGFMRLHGGDLLLESRHGKGTTAIALLPADRVLS